MEVDYSRPQVRKLTAREKDLVQALREEPDAREVLAGLVAHDNVYVSYFQPINRFDKFEAFVARFPEVAIVEEKGERGNTYALKREEYPPLPRDGPGMRERFSEMLVYARADGERAELLDRYQNHWVQVDGKEGRLVANDGRLLLVKKGSYDSFQFKGNFRLEEDKEFKGEELKMRCYKAYDVPLEFLAEHAERKLSVHPEKLEPWRVYSTESIIGHETEGSWWPKIISDAAESYHKQKVA